VLEPTRFINVRFFSDVNTIDPTQLVLAAVVESSDDAIITQTLDGTIETWNHAAERMFGYTAPEVVGRPISVLVPPERLEEEDDALERIRRGDAVRHFETERVAKDGRRVPVSITISPVRTPTGEVYGFSRIARDLTERRALERNAFHLAALIDSAEDAIASKDLDGVVQTWNKAAERMFGYSASEMIGTSIRRIIPRERWHEEDEVLARIRSGRSIEHFETVRQRKDGSLFEISLSVSPIKTTTGAIIGASKIARDITQQHRLAREAEEANRVKDEFLAMLSHELRTPLNAVLGYTRMLRDGHLGADRRERAIDTIERNANLLAQLVADVLDVSSIVTGKVRLKMGTCDLRTLVHAATDVVRPTAEAKGIELRVEAPATPVTASCDGERIQQVFWNLLSNAVKFTSHGCVSIALQNSGGRANVTVTDTGIGIPATSLPYIFQRFWQGEATVNRGGLGLGLALARHFVELHGGTIQAASAGEGKGATFTVTFPLAREGNNSRTNGT
jgi:PAS domain S-box-containing protein